MALDSDSSENFDIKNVIHYARFGKVLKQDKRLFFLQMLIYTGLSLYFITHLKLMSYYLSNFSLYFIDGPKIAKREAVEGVALYYLSYNGRLPSFLESIFVFFVTLIMLIINIKLDIMSKPFKIWLNYIVITLMVSSVYFIFFSNIFPYSLDDFSLLYIIAQIGIISFIPIITGFSLALFSFSWWLLIANFFTVCLVLVYSFLFGAIRYAFFLQILKSSSFIWMANMFFNFGPLLDMVYISGIFAFYVSILSKVARKNMRFWRWIY